MLIMYIQQFKQFLSDIRQPNEFYHKTYSVGHDLLEKLDEIEKSYPMRYGSTPTTPRSKQMKELATQGSMFTGIMSMLSPRRISRSGPK